MVFKDERRDPLKKNLRLAWAGDPAGPWQAEPESVLKSRVEGPPVARIQGGWLVCFGHHGKPQHCGACRTADRKRFDDVTSRMSFPSGHRHGTVVPISRQDRKRLEQLH
jgi:hypothetical protein